MIMPSGDSEMKHHINDMKRRALHNADAAYYFESYVQELKMLGEPADLQQIAELKERYHFDDPAPVRYLHWVWGMLHGDFGYSFEYRMPVNDVVGDRLWLTMMLSMVTIIFTWLLAFPIGLYSATRQYSWGDYGLTLLGLLGIAVPHFMLAIIMMYFANIWFGTSIGHLMDLQYLDQPMSWAKLVSVLEHLWIPVIIIGAGGTAGMIRALRANLLDELQKQYYVTARAKGLKEKDVINKHARPNAMIPIATLAGFQVVGLLGGVVITETVFNYPGIGKAAADAAQQLDVVTVLGLAIFNGLILIVANLAVDIMYGIIDPRVRLS